MLIKILQLIASNLIGVKFNILRNWPGPECSGTFPNLQLPVKAPSSLLAEVHPQHSSSFSEVLSSSPSDICTCFALAVSCQCVSSFSKGYFFCFLIYLFICVLYSQSVFRKMNISRKALSVASCISLEPL